MGFKGWLAGKTSSPTGFAQSYVSGLLEPIEILTASVVAFSGRRPLTAPTDPSAALFETHLQMLRAGFEPATSDILQLTAPTIEGVRPVVEPAFLCDTYRTITAFLCLYAENAAQRHFSAKHANEFGSALRKFLAQRVAGSYGLSPDPRETFDAIVNLEGSFVCDRILNREAFGRHDALGLILSRLAVSPDGRTQHAFVVGSQTQKVGCASMFVFAIQSIDNSLESCAKEVGW